MKMTLAFCNFQIMYTKLMTYQLTEVLAAHSVERLPAVGRVVGSIPHWRIRFIFQSLFSNRMRFRPSLTTEEHGQIKYKFSGTSPNIEKNRL